MPSESPAPAADAADLLRSKTLLVVSSGTPKKRFVFQRLKALGVKIVLVNDEANWAARYADHFVAADPVDAKAAALKVEELLKTVKVDGAVTFWEDSIPLAAHLC